MASARALLGAVLALALIPASAQAAGPPQIEATWVTGVTATAANLRAEVNPKGLESTYRFEYLTEAAYQANAQSFTGASRAPSFGEAALGEEEGPAQALQHLSGLKAATSYRYRIVARSAAAPAGVSGPALAFTTQPNASTGPEECANAQLRFEDSSFALPDCRAWEMVSPIDKNGGAVAGPEQIASGGVLQAAASGEAVTFSSAASFGEGAQGAPVASQYLSRRTEAGWQAENITGPTLSGAYPIEEAGVPYQLFSTDLARGLLLNGRRCAAEEPCPRSYSLRESQSGALAKSPEAPDLRFAGTDPGLEHPILSTCAALTPEASEVPGTGGTCDPAETNLYEWSNGQPSLINILPGEIHGTPGATLGAQAGAVSSDGSRVYFTQGGNLYLREGEETIWVDEAQGGGGLFQTASADGRFAFFTKAAHLYRYDAETETATDLTPAGGAVGVLGASADGARVYYASADGVFLSEGGSPIEVATGAKAAAPSDYPPATATARVSSDGSRLAFLSKASLTGYDNTDQQSGQPDAELYLYTAPSGGEEGSLRCISCNPTQGRPLGPSTIPGAIANGSAPGSTDLYKPRNLSTDGTRLFFDSSDAIVSRDTSAAQDVYEWEAEGTGSCQRSGGCLFLISGGAGAEASRFIDASAQGRDVFFLTADSLVRTDPGSVDLYDARELGGLPQPEAPLPCEGDACQTVPSPPEDPAPGTLVAGSANPAPHYPKTHKKKPKPKKHHGKGHHHHKRGGK